MLKNLRHKKRPSFSGHLAEKYKEAQTMGNTEISASLSQIGLVRVPRISNPQTTGSKPLHARNQDWFWQTAKMTRTPNKLIKIPNTEERAKKRVQKLGMITHGVVHHSNFEVSELRLLTCRPSDKSWKPTEVSQGQNGHWAARFQIPCKFKTFSCAEITTKPT